MARHSKSAWTIQTWFNNLKTLPKLILGFSAVGVIMIMVGLVGLIGLGRLKTELQNIYDGSTVALSNTGVSSTNLGLYHDALLNAGRQTRKSDFDDAIALADLKKQTLNPSYQGRNCANRRRGETKEGYRCVENSVGRVFCVDRRCDQRLC
jgi:twitching motility protein PilJ